MTTTSPTQPLGIGHVLQTPHSLAAIVDLARRPGTHGRTIAAFIERWAADAGTAKDALLTAPAEGLADLVRDYSPMCEGCRAPLPDWTERVEDDVPLSWCPTCAVADQHASPQNWRGWMQDRLDDIDGGSHDA